MRIERLSLENLRAFGAVAFEPAPGRTLILGGNGAGKTTLLEAAYLLAYGRSFRGGSPDALIRRGAEAFHVFSVWRDAQGRVRRLGLARQGRAWDARLDGAPVSQLAELHQACAVVCFEPGSHALLEGGSEPRRRFADWGLFHVEPAFLPVWRRYQRALRQRNALLKQGPTRAALLPWDRELAESGSALHAFREAYLAGLAPGFARTAALFLPELGPATLRYSAGWLPGSALDAALAEAAPRDLRLGFTSVGPHRGDWRPVFEGLGSVDMLSRGQEKLTALAALLAQAEDLSARRAEWPLLLLDDLGSELDRAHQAQVWGWLQARPLQAWITGTEAPHGSVRAQPDAVFHVEQGAVHRA